jgi:2-dehydro-3-deoxyphosphogluconate aldolase/(4S)-4-hydroxy-2-oxoglutarate aldolase
MKGKTTVSIETVLARFRIVPVVVLDDAEAAEPLADALVAGGLGIAEITLRTPAALAAIRTMAKREDVVVGAGTVLTPAQVEAAVDAGARFVVSPGTSPAVVARARDLGVGVLPGAVTATELQAAVELGVTTLKFFPASAAGGVGTLKALAAPFPGVRFVPTGGIHAGNVAEYLALASVVAVGGSWMVPASAVAAGDFERVRALTAEAVALTGGGVRGGEA